jgi:hypothetical protein
MVLVTDMSEYSVRTQQILSAVSLWGSYCIIQDTQSQPSVRVMTFSHLSSHSITYSASSSTYYSILPGHLSVLSVSYTANLLIRHSASLSAGLASIESFIQPTNQALIHLDIHWTSLQFNYLFSHFLNLLFICTWPTFHPFNHLSSLSSKAINSQSPSLLPSI